MSQKTNAGALSHSKTLRLYTLIPISFPKPRQSSFLDSEPQKPLQPFTLKAKLVKKYDQQHPVARASAGQRCLGFRGVRLSGLGGG